jgi:predicted SAM-dependent methyltransferase
MIKKVIKKIAPPSVTRFLIYFQQYREAERRAEAAVEKNRKKIESLIQSPLPIKLELGAGENRGIPGWTYIDSNDQCDLDLDLAQPLPFPDDRVDIIYSSHLMEHFKYTDLLKFLAECLRILKPGGKFSAAVPNARIYLNAYYDPDKFNSEMFCRYKQAYHYNSKIDYVNYMAYMDGHHQYMFDEENLLEVLKKAGFSNVALRYFDKGLDLEFRDFQSIYVEAEK